MKEQPARTDKLIRWLAHSYWTPVLSVTGAVIIYFLAQIIGGTLLALFQAAQGWSNSEIKTWFETSLVANFTLRLIVSIVGIWLVYGVLRFLGLKWSAIGLKRPRLRDTVYALVGYGWYLMIYFLSLFLVSWLIPSINFEQSQQLGFSTDTTGPSLILIFVSLVILPPLFEEILTRGFLYKGLRSKLSMPVAGLITSLLFAAAHLEWGSEAPLLWVAAIDTFVLSLVLVYLRERTGSLWPCIGLHAIKNCAAFLLLFVFKLS